MAHIRACVYTILCKYCLSALTFSRPLEWWEKVKVVRQIWIWWLSDWVCWWWSCSQLCVGSVSLNWPQHCGQVEVMWLSSSFPAGVFNVVTGIGVGRYWRLGGLKIWLRARAKCTHKFSDHAHFRSNCAHFWTIDTTATRFSPQKNKR